MTEPVLYRTAGGSAVGGFGEVVVSVYDIDRIADVLVAVAGWERRALPDAPAEQHEAWGVAAGARIEQALLAAPGEGHGFLRLVRFHDAGPQRPMRPSQHSWDTGGIFDIDVYVQDLEAVYAKLQRHGWTAFGPPTDYGWGGFEVREVLTMGPDGVVIGLIKAYGKVLIELAPNAGMSRAFNSAQVVRDYDAALRFYLDGLGWRAMVDTEVIGVEEPGRNIMGIPRPLATTVRRRVAMLHPEGLNDGSIELIEMRELDGDDYAADCVAPNIGYLGYRVPVGDARAYRDEVVAGGVTLYRDLAPIDIAPYGRCLGFSVRTPDGTLIDFIERRATAEGPNSAMAAP